VKAFLPAPLLNLVVRQRRELAMDGSKNLLVRWAWVALAIAFFLFGSAILTLVTGLERAFSGGSQRMLSVSEVLMAGAAVVNLVAFCVALAGNIRGRTASLWIALCVSGVGLLVSITWTVFVVIDRAS
jgi:hypothetical protein